MAGNDGKVNRRTSGVNASENGLSKVGTLSLLRENTILFSAWSKNTPNPENGPENDSISIRNILR